MSVVVSAVVAAAIGRVSGRGSHSGCVGGVGPAAMMKKLEQWSVIGRSKPEGRRKSVAVVEASVVTKDTGTCKRAADQSIDSRPWFFLWNPSSFVFDL